MNARINIFTVTTLGRIWWQSYARPSLPPGKPRYSFFRRFSGPQVQSGHEEVKKNLHPSDTRGRIRAVQPVAKRLQSILVKLWEMKKNCLMSLLLPLQTLTFRSLCHDEGNLGLVTFLDKTMCWTFMMWNSMLTLFRKNMTEAIHVV